MNITVDGGNPSDNLICPRCSTSIPPHAIFCGSCGMPINKKKKNEEEEVHTENDDDDAQEQEADETVRLPSLSQAHLKELQSYRSLKNNRKTEQTYKSSSLSQDVEAPTFIGMKLINDKAPESLLVSNNNSVVTGSTSDAWGWLPVLSLTSAVGVFLVALAGDAGRVASQWADLLFWLGLLTLFLPIALRLLSSKPARRERIAL